MMHHKKKTQKIMNQSIESFLLLIFGAFCIVFGVDKFIEFLPTCSLVSVIPKEGMLITGVLEIVLGLLILLKKYTLASLQIATAIIIGGLMLHLITGTFDISGAVFGAVLGVGLIISQKRKNR